MTDEMVVLCTPEGAAAGVLPKSMAHHHATPLHLAFSCYLFDQDGNFLVNSSCPDEADMAGSDHEQLLRSSHS